MAAATETQGGAQQHEQDPAGPRRSPRESESRPKSVAMSSRRAIPPCFGIGAGASSSLLQRLFIVTTTSGK